MVLIEKEKLFNLWNRTEKGRLLRVVPVFHKEEFKNSVGIGIFYKLSNQNVIKFKGV